MASLKQVIRDHKGAIEDGIAWVAIWRVGRSWYGESFWPEDGGYEDGYDFSPMDVFRMGEIMNEDHKAIMINGYYTNCGTVEDEVALLADLIDGAEWNYYNRYNQLSSFFEGWVR